MNKIKINLHIIIFIITHLISLQLKVLISHIESSCCVFSQSLDLTTKRMIHEGPLTWKVSKDKQIGQYV